MQILSSYQCSYCGEMIETDVDPSAGSAQSYVEDCSVCCRPNVLRVSVSPDYSSASIQAEFEG